jgi:hypothetical protein
MALNDVLGSKTDGPAFALRSAKPAHPSDLRPLGEGERVFHINAEIANPYFDLGMAE